MLDQTIIQGEMTPESREQLIAISLQLQMTEAEAVGWALERCGLTISFPSKLFNPSDSPCGG